MLLYVALQGLLPQRIAAAADQLASSHAWLAVSRLDRDLCLLETHPHAADDFSVRATPITRFIALLATRFHPSLLQSLITVSVRPVAASIESIATAAMTGQLARYDQSLLPSNPPPPPPPPPLLLLRLLRFIRHLSRCVNDCLRSLLRLTTGGVYSRPVKWILWLWSLQRTKPDMAGWSHIWRCASRLSPIHISSNLSFTQTAIM